MGTAVVRPDVGLGQGVLGRALRVARTAPGRLAAGGVLLVVLALLAGLFAFLGVRERAAAADRIATRSEPLGLRTQELYRALAEADAAAAAGVLSGGVEKAELRDDYNQSLDTAQRLLMAAPAAGHSGRVGELMVRLSVEIPRYREDVARAKAETRQGHPLGAAYLRVASRQMEEVILPAARELYGIAAERLRRDHREASSVPWSATVFALVALAALVAAQILLARRTKRVFNPGLVLAAAVVAAVVAWVATGTASARDDLATSRDDGWRPMAALSDVRFAVLQARAAEGQVLVQNGSDGGAYQAKWTGLRDELTRSGGLLDRAERLGGDDDFTASRLADVRAAVADWSDAHQAVVNEFNKTNYTGAVTMVIEDSGPAQIAFSRAEKALTEAITGDQDDFTRAVGGARGATDGLETGVLVLAIGAAAGIVDGVRRRLGEYR